MPCVGLLPSTCPRRVAGLPTSTQDTKLQRPSCSRLAGGSAIPGGLREVDPGIALRIAVTQVLIGQRMESGFFLLQRLQRNMNLDLPTPVYCNIHVSLRPINGIVFDRAM